MKTKLVSWLLILAPSLLIAQPGRDSLLIIWDDTTLTDSIRVEAYRTYLVDNHLMTNPDTTFLMAQDLISYANEHDYPRAEAIGLNAQGVTYSIKGDYMKALKAFTESREVFQRMGDIEGVSHCTNNIGLIYMYQDSHAEALDHFLQSLEVREEMGDRDAIASSMMNIGAIYFLQGKLDKALEYQEKSLRISEELNLDIGTAGSLHNIGNVYQEQGRYADALDKYFESLRIVEKVGDKAGVVNNLNYIGQVYHLLGKNDKAVTYCDQAFDLAEKIGTLDFQKVACECLYDAYKDLGRSDKAIAMNDKIREIDQTLEPEKVLLELQKVEFEKSMLEDSIRKAEETRLVKEQHEEEVRSKEMARNIGFGVGIIFILMAGGLYSRMRYIRKTRSIIEKERDRSDNLLLNILPREIAQELKENGQARARDYEMVSILFTDFKSFTEHSAKLTASELVDEINECFREFDMIIEKFGIEKIKTIGDAYMAAGGLPVPEDDSVKKTVLAALELQNFVIKRKKEREAENKISFEMRVGVHTGPVVAGIVGVKKFQYDIWGDTVNTASRLESSGKVGRVNISQVTYEAIKDDPEFKFEHRGRIEVKGKGEMDMWFVELA